MFLTFGRVVAAAAAAAATAATVFDILGLIGLQIERNLRRRLRIGHPRQVARGTLLMI